MSVHKIIIAGFGGQGVMSMGMILAYAGMIEGKEVTWLPSYGPEMRGGTANCSVVISDKPISSPVITKATAVVVMNKPSLPKFEDKLIPEGMLFMNTSLIDEESTRKDVDVCKVAINEMAVKLENDKVANMVMLGSIIGKTKAVTMDSVEEVLKKLFTGKKEKLIPLNIKALQEGISGVS